jgi:hypothetical protein
MAKGMIRLLTISKDKGKIRKNVRKTFDRKNME